MKFLYRQDYRGYLVSLVLAWQEKPVITLLHTELQQDSVPRRPLAVVVCAKTPWLLCFGLKWSSVQTEDHTSSNIAVG